MKNPLLTFALISSIICQAHAADSNPDLNDLRNEAKKGDMQSQLEYGKAIRNKSKDQAELWIQKAADQGSGEALYWLGYAGLGKERPIFYYKKAAEKGYPEAYPFLLDEFLFRAGSSANIEEAKKFADLARKFNVKFYDAEPILKTIDRCYEAGAATIPLSDQPTSQEMKTFKNSKANCSSFQTGISTKQDWSNYRKCVLSQSEINTNDLAEIYANGWGVKRNPKLALSLVCHGGSVPAEVVGMVEALYSTQDKERLEEEFYFCNYVTSSMNGGICAANEEATREEERELEFSALKSQWTESQKNQLNTLQKAADNFFSEHAASEQDLSGTARVQIVISKESSLKDAFITNIKKFEMGQLPNHSDFAKSDKDLNTLYYQIMKKPKPQEYGTVRKEGIKATQRKWIRYRDAWVKFVEVKYPDHSSETWKAWLTKQRIEQLKEFITTN
jgi:uncharacterized protein YecT (DUF1311 family)